MGAGYITLDGTSANYASTPDTAELDIVGDIWLAGKFALDDWTPASAQTLIAKWEDTGDERSYRLYVVATTGVLRLEWSTDGTAVAAVTADSTVAPTVSDGNAITVAATLDISTGDVKFYTSDGTTWTQLGTTVSGAGATSIYAGTGVLEVGSDNTGTAQLLIGDLYDAEVRDGYDLGVGDAVFRADFSLLTAAQIAVKKFVELSSSAAVVTLNGSAWVGVAGRKRRAPRHHNQVEVT